MSTANQQAAPTVSPPAEQGDDIDVKPPLWVQRRPPVKNLRPKTGSQSLGPQPTHPYYSSGFDLERSTRGRRWSSYLSSSMFFPSSHDHVNNPEQHVVRGKLDEGRGAAVRLPAFWFRWRRRICSCVAQGNGAGEATFNVVAVLITLVVGLIVPTHHCALPWLVLFWWTTQRQNWLFVILAGIPADHSPSLVAAVGLTFATAWTHGKGLLGEAEPGEEVLVVLSVLSLLMSLVIKEEHIHLWGMMSDIIHNATVVVYVGTQWGFLIIEAFNGEN